jgi:hypothetical protein
VNSSSAERWVTTSALVVAAVYAYRRLTESAQPGTAKNVIGVGTPVPLGQFATAWGFTFLVVAVMAQASPELGGGFAVLIGTADLLTNSASVFGDVNKQTGTTTSAPLTATVNGQTMTIPNVATLPTLSSHPPTPLPRG